MKKEYILKLYNLHADSIYRFAYAYMGSAADAEDVVQNVFLKLIQRRISISSGKEKSYLMSMAANACKDLFKSGNVRRKADFEDIYGMVSEEILSKEESNLFIAMKQLSEKYRAVLHLHYYEGYTIKEISKILKISQSAVSMRLTRGRKELKELLSKEDLS